MLDPCLMLDKYTPSPFIDPAAVEAWDIWFRWREHGALRDVSVEATWRRVAIALAEVEAANPTLWMQRFFDAQSQWQLVFDERILASAGTPVADWPNDPVAVLNAACFVAAPCAPKAYFDFDAFRNTAELALRCLDNALLSRTQAGCALHRPCVGLIGVADALVLLGKRYDSAGARVLAGNIAQALAEGCLCANARLARDRGPQRDSGDAPLALARSRDMPRELLDEIQRRGVRHAQPTAITSQHRLALFANNVSDALDPLEAQDTTRTIASGIGSRVVRSPGHACDLAGNTGCDKLAGTASNESAEVSIAAQIELRGAVQPWVDAPIDYPLRVSHQLDAPAQAHWQQLASAYRLGNLRWPRV